MQSQSFPSFLEEIRPLVWSVIERYLPRREPFGHYQIVREYPERQGKYLRPGLLILGAELFGGYRDDALCAAAAIQFSEEWLLIHDDVEDHSQFRRRTKEFLNPTLHRVYGDELAINAGDALHLIMWQVVGDAMREMPTETGQEFFKRLNSILLTTTEGQFMELSWIHEQNFGVTENDYCAMTMRKTGCYTTAGPLQLGALLAGASAEDIAAIAEWALPLGTAFQIIDDVLNLTEWDEAIGKERGGDIIEGKRTIPLIHLLRSSRPVERAYITNLYRKDPKERVIADADHVIGLMERYGSIAYALRVAETFATTARERFELQTYPTPVAKKILQDAIQFIVERKR